MKKLLVIALLLAGAGQLKAQQLQLQTPDNVKKLLENTAAAKVQADSWNHLKSTLKLNDVVALNNNYPGFDSNDAFRDNMPVVVLEGKSKMPIVKLPSYSKMPVLNLGPVDLDKLNKQKLTRFY
jgi:hypothetical protein